MFPRSHSSSLGNNVERSTLFRAVTPAEANIFTYGDAREPRKAKRCCFQAPSAQHGCFLNLPTEAFEKAFSSSGLLTTELCSTVTTTPCPTPRPAGRRRRWRSTRPRTSSTSRRQRCAYLPPDLCPSASLTGAMPCSGAAVLLQRAADPGRRIRQRPQERHQLASRTLPARPRAS